VSALYEVQLVYQGHVAAIFFMRPRNRCKTLEMAKAADASQQLLWWVAQRNVEEDLSLLEMRGLELEDAVCTEHGPGGNPMVTLRVRVGDPFVLERRSPGLADEQARVLAAFTQMRVPGYALAQSSCQRADEVVEPDFGGLLRVMARATDRDIFEDVSDYVNQGGSLPPGIKEALSQASQW